MFGRRVVIAILTLAATGSLLAQSAGEAGRARDFWLGTGRYAANIVEALQSKKDRDPAPDLSGTYQVLGHGVDATRTWRTTLDMKRAKTLTTPQGNEVNTYSLKWNWDDVRVDGVGILVGKRLYMGYGRPDIGLMIAAPFELSKVEQHDYDLYWDVVGEAKQKSRANVQFSIKNRPWFYQMSPAREHYPETMYYCLWMNLNGAYGHQFLRGMSTWSEGSYYVSGNRLKDNGEYRELTGDFSKWEVTKVGQNFRYLQSGSLDKKEDGSAGTAVPLDDGTVVVILTGGGKGYRVGYYEVRDNVLSGQWAEQFTDARATEILTPTPEIIAKNPKLFAK